MYQLVVLHPLVDLGLSQTQDVLGGVGRVLATADIQEVQTGRGLVQSLFVTGGVTVETTDKLLDQSGGLGIVFFLANDLLHVVNILSGLLNEGYYTTF